MENPEKVDEQRICHMVELCSYKPGPNQIQVPELLMNPELNNNGS